MGKQPHVEARRMKILSFLEADGKARTSDQIWAACFPSVEMMEEWCPVLRRPVMNFTACEGYGRRVISHTHAEIRTAQADVLPSSVYGYLRELRARGLVVAIKVGNLNYYRAVNSPVSEAQRKAEILELERLFNL